MWDRTSSDSVWGQVLAMRGIEFIMRGIESFTVSDSSCPHTAVFYYMIGLEQIKLAFRASTEP